MAMADRPGSALPQLVTVGVVLALVGACGDLIWHGLHPDAHAAILPNSVGELPWHVMLLLGLGLAGVGTILGALQRRTEGGALFAASLVLLLVVTGGAAGWTLAADRGTPTEHLAGPQGVHAAHPATRVSHAGHGLAGAGHEHLAAPGPVPAQTQAMLQRVRAATAKFRDTAVARADGYFRVTQFIPGIAMHWYNPRYAGTFDPMHPALLLYRPVSGRLDLAGVGYLVPKVSAIPPVGFPGTADLWHFHNDLCFIAGSVVPSDAASCSAAHGVFQSSTGWMLHAWLFAPHPTGVFAPVDPAIS